MEPLADSWERRLRALPRRVRRALQRHFALPLAELALLLALWQGPAWATTINVDGTTCTLAAAITAADTDAVSGGCTAGSGADTLELPAGGTLTLTAVDNTTDGANGLPVVSSVITIAGQGSTLERSGSAPAFRLLAVRTGGNLTIQDLTLQGGSAAANGGGVHSRDGTLTLVNSTLTGNSAGYKGGGIYTRDSMLTLVNSTLTGNSASNNGGGVATLSGTISLMNNLFMGNSAGYKGGGVYTRSEMVTLAQSTISGNTASQNGGGITNYGGTFTLANSTLSGNSSGYKGGGVYTRSGTFTLVNSTLSGNTSTQNGGGVANYGGAFTLANSTLSGNSSGYKGGGVYRRSSTFTLANSTLSGNTAPYRGGGMANYGGAITLANSTLSGNSSSNSGGVYTRNSTITLAQSLITGNTAATGAEIRTVGGSVTVDSVNLFGQNGTSGIIGFSPGGTDVVPSAGVLLSDILDSTLSDNGGPTLTHALVSGSPALDVIPTGSCAIIDQRGFVRPSVGSCDIGAVELDGSVPPVVNSRVSFVVLPDTYSTTTDTTGCPGGFVGRFFFQARLTALAGSPPLSSLMDEVLTLTNSNLVQTADGGAAGVSSFQTLPWVEAFDDGVLAATETVDVPFVICLQSMQPFQFIVDVLGVEQPL